jgi:hypothetical protein
MLARVVCSVALLATVGLPSLHAQQELPLSPVPPRGLHVSPWFEGWYLNGDGTYTLSFGFFNRNSTETIEIPIGPENRIEPAELDGVQPSVFTPGRERGVFAITVPKEYANRDIVWTLTNRGGSYAVPGRVTSPAYELGHSPMAEGSVPPALRFEEGGGIARGPGGAVSPRVVQTRVGAAVPLTLWIDDLESKRAPVPLNITWHKHSGPGAVSFEPQVQRAVVDGRGEVTVTFTVAGEYVIRARVDNHAQRDSAPAEQCCWTNGFFRVTVID